MKDGFNIADESGESGRRSSRSRTKERIKSGLIVVLLVVVVALIVRLVTLRPDQDPTASTTPHSEPRPIGPVDAAPPPAAGPPSAGSPSVCVTKGCIHESDRLLHSMNMSADPCEDFNAFACGQFISEARIPDDKGRYSSWTPLSERLYKRGEALLKKEKKEEEKEEEWESYEKARAFYRACMNESLLEEIGLKPAMEQIVNIVGGWPVLETMNDTEKSSGWSDFVWHEATLRLSSAGMGRSQIVSVNIYTDDKNSSIRAIFMDQPSLGLSREYLVKGEDDKDVQAYFQYMVSTALLFGGDSSSSETRSRVESELRSVLAFEMALANASDPKEERRNSSKLYNPYVLEEYKALSHHPPSWHAYIDALVAEVDLDRDERIIVQNPQYLIKLNAILERTEPRVIANYLAWRVAKSSMQYLNADARRLRFQFQKVIYGYKEQTPRWKTCTAKGGFLSYSSSSFKVAAGSMYVRKYFPKEAKASMSRMIGYLRQSFEQILNDIDWMDEQTKNRAHDKLKKIRQFIAYPDEFLNRTIVDKHYKDLQIDESDYYGGWLRLSRWHRSFVHRRLRELVDKDDWRKHSTVAVVNAFYSSSVNGIEFPAGILQDVFFEYSRPEYLNYGGIGGVIGHEITHGFDDRGKQYDGDGNLRDWWDKETQEKFAQRAQCIVDQYGGYKDTEHTGLNLNGVATQGENIADNGGIKEAYNAYERYLSDLGHEEPKLPGLEFSGRQLFWLSWAQVWCVRFRGESLKNQIMTGVHSPGQFRIQGPLANQEAFARDFNCPKGSKMNPEHKCVVW